jgi:glycosyltransferase involved in cell wall biosynthesis
MSCYNGLPYVEEAVQSILAQTFREFRFVIVDDASSDGSRELLQKLAKQDDRVTLLLNEQNFGLTNSLNRGIAITDSEWIARMDADDVALPHRLENQWRHVKSHPELLLLGSNVIFIDECGKPFPVNSRIPLKHEEIDASLLVGGWPIFHPTVLVKTSVLKQIGGYRKGIYLEDHDLFLRLAENGRVANLSEKLLYYRRHQGARTIPQPQKKDPKRPIDPGPDDKTRIILEAFRRRGWKWPPFSSYFLPLGRLWHQKYARRRVDVFYWNLVTLHRPSLILRVLNSCYVRYVMLLTWARRWKKVHDFEPPPLDSARR